ncbi:MAG: hypothetical protein ACREBW_08720 [Candidatus Micrarchaeaceae archaeon]
MAKDKGDKSKSLEFRVSGPLHSYLGFLSRNTVLGQKETDVTRALLTERLNQMIRTKEHLKLKPPEDDDGKAENGPAPADS